jgi:tRNA(fMet)-specific endonuclease VapC
MRICLDTNAYSAFKRGDADIIDLVETADEVSVPSIVLGELFAGFRMGSRTRRNTAELDDFLHRPGVSVAGVTRAVAERYGMLVGQLRQQGTPLPTNDIWIAAVALERGAQLVTLDAHFDDVPGVFATGLEP